MRCPAAGDLFALMPSQTGRDFENLGTGARMMGSSRCSKRWPSAKVALDGAGASCSGVGVGQANSGGRCCRPFPHG